MEKQLFTVQGTPITTEEVILAKATLTLTPSEVTLYLNDASKKLARLTARLGPSALDGGGGWSSSLLPDVVSVESGVVKARKEGGPFTITATSVAYPNLQATCTMTVSNGEPNPEEVLLVSVRLNKRELKLSVGEEEILVVTIESTAATDKHMSWKSSNPLVVSVIDGRVRVLKGGKSTITVTTNSGGHTDHCEVSVSEKGDQTFVESMLLMGVSVAPNRFTSWVTIRGVENAARYEVMDGAGMVLLDAQHAEGVANWC